jgi:hypothetical protein
VETICILPLVYRTGEKSIREHFEPARPHLANRPAFLSAVGARLRKQPDLIDAWQRYCQDKRTTGPYLDVGSLEVGIYEVASGCREVSVHASPVEACADFIHREASAVLKGARTL